MVRPSGQNQPPVFHPLRGADSETRREKIGKLLPKHQAALTRAFGHVPPIAIILGSGFQRLETMLRKTTSLDYAELPGFPSPAVTGHPGRFVCGSVKGIRVLLCCGRSHYYEGFSMKEVTHLVRVLAGCGVSDLVLTNAAGGINRRFRTGDFMLFSDHINLMGTNPLRGEPVTDGRCFVDMTYPYSPRLGRMVSSAARRAQLRMHQGVYLAVSGPSYETPAEIKAFRRLGADAVGMSTVPEVILARYYGMEVAAISCITNPAAGVRKTQLSHEEVLKVGEQSAENAIRLLQNFLYCYDRG